jgi:DNA-binding transcriptional LysR family regulator
MSGHGLVALEAVLAIAARGSFRAAALELDLSTTALSNLIGRIEKELGVRLFNRTTRSVSLTDAGRRFVEQVTPALHDIHDAIAAVRSQQDTPSGTLRINAFASGAREILAPLVLAFLRRFQQVHVDIITEGRIVDIVAEGFDLGLRPADLVPSDMIPVAVGEPRRFAVVATPSYFQTRGRPRLPPDLLQHPCIRIRLPNGAPYRWHFEKDGNALQIVVDGPITLDESSLSRIAVLDGIGIGFFMEADIRNDIAAGRLERVLEDWTPPTSPLCLYYPGRKNQSAALRAFIEMARRLGRSGTGGK